MTEGQRKLYQHAPLRKKTATVTRGELRNLWLSRQDSGVQPNRHILRNWLSREGGREIIRDINKARRPEDRIAYKPRPAPSHGNVMTMPAEEGQYVIFPPSYWRLHPVTLFMPSSGPEGGGLDFREAMYMLCADETDQSYGCSASKYKLCIHCGAVEIPGWKRCPFC
jgi:hypothetical protein